MDCSSKEKFPVVYYNRVNELEWSSAAASRLLSSPPVWLSWLQSGPSTAGTHRPLAGGDAEPV